MLDFSSVIGLTTFALVTGITPGPNNLLLAHSGANFGIRKTIPHFIGTCTAFGFMLVSIYFGAGKILIKLPALSTILLIICSGYMFYLAIKIFFNSASTSSKDLKPLCFRQGFLLQFINPKLWMVALASSGFIKNSTTILSLETLEVLFIMLMISIPAMGFWVISGSSFQQWMQTPEKRQWFNGGLSFLTLLTIPVLWLS